MEPVSEPWRAVEAEVEATPVQPAQEPAAPAAEALWDASQAGDLDEIARLLAGGAEVDVLVSMYVPNGDIVQSTALYAAAGDGQLDAVRLLLDRGADPSLATSIGFTALINAAMGGHVAVVRELAARGADLDAAHPETGLTAFHCACGNNQPECVAALVELGCGTGIKDKDGRTGKQ